MTTTAAELRAELAKIDERTAALQSQLQLLSEQRQSVLQRLDAAVYPILTLPPEITADIFVHYLVNFPVITYDCASKAYPPLILASVCREWRRVALSFPRLWATLKLKWDPKTVVRREKLLRFWLLRAGGCLLDLDLSDSNLTESTSSSAAIVHIPPLSWKNLHTLRLHPSSFWHLFDFLAVPALKTLELGFPIESDLDILLSFISRSSCTVQVLHLHNQAPEEIVECLQLFESLEDLTIQYGDLWHTRFEEEYYLKIEDEYCPIVFGFLKERGQLPALKSLSFVDFPMAIDTALLTSMLNSRRRSRGVANLESFKLVFTHPEGYEEAHASKLRSLVDRGLSIHIEWTGEPSKSVNPELVARINAAS
ncbi:hypothetical protein C8J57DRAFT_1513223 [Mycena rebaudengoi]|nr:hypothetical protein C8J57DRAFT_1513223 [Mycena rebaudengoi]